MEKEERTLSHVEEEYETGTDGSSNGPLCQGPMRDTMINVYSYLQRPNELRQCCRFTLLCFNHAIYLEIPLSCDYIVASRESESELDRVLPITSQAMKIVIAEDEHDK